MGPYQGERTGKNTLVVRESETGRPVGREAERGPHTVCEHQGLGDSDAWRYGVPVPLEIPWLRTHHSSSGLFYLSYYSFHFEITFYF